MSLYGIRISLDNDLAFEDRSVNTLTAYGLALAEEGFSVSAPEVKASSIDIRGMDGVLDTSEIPQGFPTFHNRTITCKLFRAANPFRPSDVIDMEATLSSFLGQWQGRKCRFVLPDDTTRYFVGRASFGMELDTGFITMTAEVYPYRLSGEWTETLITGLTTSYQTYTLTNDQRFVIPEVTALQTTTVQVLAGVSSIPPEVTIAAGTHVRPEFLLGPGEVPVQAKTASGSGGQLYFTYREGRL